MSTSKNVGSSPSLSVMNLLNAFSQNIKDTLSPNDAATEYPSSSPPFSNTTPLGPIGLGVKIAHSTASTHFPSPSHSQSHSQSHSHSQAQSHSHSHSPSHTQSHSHSHSHSHGHSHSHSRTSSGEASSPSVAAVAPSSSSSSLAEASPARNGRSHSVSSRGSAVSSYSSESRSSSPSGSDITRTSSSSDGHGDSDSESESDRASDSDSDSSKSGSSHGSGSHDGGDGREISSNASSDVSSASKKGGRHSPPPPGVPPASAPTPTPTPTPTTTAALSSSCISTRAREGSFPSIGGRNSIASTGSSGGNIIGRGVGDTSGGIANTNSMKVFLKSMSPDIEQVRQCEEYFSRIQSFGGAPGGDAIAAAVNKHLSSILAVHQSGEELASELQKLVFPGSLQYMLAEALSSSHKKMYAACEEQKGILKSLIGMYDKCRVTEAQLEGYQNQQMLINTNLERCNHLREKFKTSFYSKEDNVIDSALYDTSRKLQECQEQCEVQLETLGNGLSTFCSKLQRYMTEVLMGVVKMEKSLRNINVATLDEIEPAYQRLHQKSDPVSLEHVLNDTEYTEQFCAFVATTGRCTESLDFWIDAEKFRKTSDTTSLVPMFQEMHKKYIDENGPAPISIPDIVRQDLNVALTQKEVFSDSLFTAQEYALSALRENVFNDFAQRFLREPTTTIEKRYSMTRKTIGSIEDILLNPIALEYFMKFLQVQSKSIESNSLRFWLEAELACNIRSVTEGTTALNKDIYESYFPADAPYYIPWHTKIRDETLEKVLCRVPAFNIFAVPKNLVLNMLKKTAFQQFLASPLYQEYLELITTQTRPKKSPAYLSTKKRADSQGPLKENCMRVDIVFKGTIYPEAFKKFLVTQKHPALLHFECWNEIDKYARNPSKQRAQEIFNKFLVTESTMAIPTSIKAVIESELQGDNEPLVTVFASLQEKNVEAISAAFERFLKTSIFKDAKKERKKLTEQANKERANYIRLSFR
ncbi:hypothetical protein Pelo_12723 [Pelomyxa schiedti]|nr:hypothetical protein Pelo_12723 [Pelomyxa schiedti]